MVKIDPKEAARVLRTFTDGQGKSAVMSPAGCTITLEMRDVVTIIAALEQAARRVTYIATRPGSLDWFVVVDGAAVGVVGAVENNHFSWWLNGLCGSEPDLASAKVAVEKALEGQSDG